ncbi:hypothetical protein KJ678_04070 [Patescibacteria group bacterium]|nr:hypothetical protein [Patescibacteria group bacterium]
MKKSLLVGLVVVALAVFLASVSFAETTALWLEPFVMAGGVVSSSSITVTGGEISVGIGIYNGAATTVTVKIPYQPGGPFRFVGVSQTAGFTGSSADLQGGYFVWQGTLICHTPLKSGCGEAGEPEQFILKLQTLQEGVFTWEIVVQEQNFPPVFANPVTVTVASVPLPATPTPTVLPPGTCPEDRGIGLANKATYFGMFTAYDHPVPTGSEVRAYSPREELVGCGKVQWQEGAVTFTNVYGTEQGYFQGMEEGEAVTWRYNDEVVVTDPMPLVWHFGDFRQITMTLSAPTSTPTPTPTPTPLLHGWVFFDRNRNGFRDLEEKDGPSGVEVQLKDSTGQVALWTKSVCDTGWYEFEPVLKGEYELDLTLPDGFETTTSERVGVEVPRGEVVNFGIVPIIPTPTPTPTATPTVKRPLRPIKDLPTTPTP